MALQLPANRQSVAHPTKMGKDMITSSLSMPAPRIFFAPGYRVYVFVADTSFGKFFEFNINNPSMFWLGVFFMACAGMLIFGVNALFGEHDD